MALTLMSAPLARLALGRHLVEILKTTVDSPYRGKEGERGTTCQLYLIRQLSQR